MWQSRTKDDLTIEVWEKLDCESIGKAEIVAIETVLLDQFGKSAVESPMQIARLLADEGAELRHSEIMQLYVERSSEQPYEAALRNLIDFSSLKSAFMTLRNVENLRRRYQTDGDKEGLRLIHQEIKQAKFDAVAAGKNERSPLETRELNIEIAEWLTLWLQSPQIFEAWITIRRSSSDFKTKFPDFE